MRGKPAILLLAVSLTACGSAPIVKVAETTQPGVIMYVSGITDAKLRSQFESYERGQANTSVSEVSSVSSSPPVVCHFTIKGYTIDIAADSNLAALAANLACSAVQNNGLPGLTQGSSSTEQLATPSATPDTRAPVVESGSGSQLTSSFSLPAGNWRVSWSAHSIGDNPFFNIIAYAVGQDKNLLIATTDTSGSTFFQSGGGNFYLEVDAQGAGWQITFDPIS